MTLESRLTFLIFSFYSKLKITFLLFICYSKTPTLLAMLIYVDKNAQLQALKRQSEQKSSVFFFSSVDMFYKHFSQTVYTQIRLILQESGSTLFASTFILFNTVS